MYNKKFQKRLKELLKAFYKQAHSESTKKGILYAKLKRELEKTQSK